LSDRSGIGRRSREVQVEINRWEKSRRNSEIQVKSQINRSKKPVRFRRSLQNNEKQGGREALLPEHQNRCQPQPQIEAPFKKILRVGRSVD
jgi:hypothetical protein